MSKAAFTLYNASAGAGKTFTLVKEYLKIILLSPKPDAYRNILAITFTNKAVNEMKSRIVDTLYELSKENSNEKALEIAEAISRDEKSLTLPVIHAKAKEIIKSLIHNYAAFDISTIDKFTHKVIRSFAHDLNLPITFEVSLETENLLNEAVDSLIARAGEDEQLTKFLVDYTMEKTDDDKSWDVSGELFDIGKLLQNENNREEIQYFKNVSLGQFLEIKKKLQHISNLLLEENKTKATQILQFLNEKGIDLTSFSGQYFPNHLKKLQAGDYNPNQKTYHNFEDIGIKKSAPDKSLIETLVPQLLQELESIYSGFEKVNSYQAVLRNITPLSLLNVIDDELATIQKDKNVLSIAEFNKLINEQIKDQPAPFIYERMGERYKHFFIDEFQDTSEMQWQNLIPLIDNALSSEDLSGVRGSLLLVGDPKQSIYRWRGGKAEQFIDLEKNHNPFSNKDFTSIPLDTNYRSYENIINFNNEFFKWISQKFDNEDYKKLYAEKSHQNSNAKKGGFISIEFLPKTSKEEKQDEDFDKNELQLSATLETINKIVSQGFLHREIVLLVRKNEQGVWLANYLIENKIPIISSESLLLVNDNDIKTLIWFLEYINNNEYTEAKAEMLYAIASQKVDKEAVHDFIFEGLQHKSEQEFENYLKANQLEISFSVLRKKPLYEVVEYLVKTVSVHKNSAYIQFFQDLILEHELKRQAGILEFLDYWEKNNHKFSIPLPESNNAVRIMTIHKAKGLEFPVVIMPFASQNYDKRVPEKMWLSYDETEIGMAKALVNKNNSVAQFGDENAAVYLQKKQEDLLDDINVLYVALTRAVEQLYIISEIEERKKDTSYPNTLGGYFLDFIDTTHKNIENFKFTTGNPARVSKPKPFENPTVPMPIVTSILDKSKIKIAQKEALMWNTPQQEAIAYGNTLHEILSNINTAEDIDKALDTALFSGLINLSQNDIIKPEIEKIVANEALQVFFSNDVKVLNERSILQKNQPILKPDRIVIDTNNNAYLLDYKTGAHQKKHEIQLQHYQQAIENLGYTLVKKVLVYIGETVEIVEV